MLVTYILGKCPGCGTEEAFGNVEVHSTYVLRGCKKCRYRQHIPLPPIRKAVLYLDQFFFSHAFRGGEPRFLKAAHRIKRATALQLLTVPYSSVHEDETHQWEQRDELFKFVKATSRGQEFEPAYDVDKTQLLKAFQAWRKGAASLYALEAGDALPRDLHDWDSYLRIEVGKYMGDIELIRDLKAQSAKWLVDQLDGWRKSTTSFEENLKAEFAVAAKMYFDAYLKYMVRVGSGDFAALLDSPIVSQVVQAMLLRLPKDAPPLENLKTCAQFFASDHFRQTPYQNLSARMFATLKEMVKAGAYTNKTKALQKLAGVAYDVKHIATYAPYCDGFVMDQPMAQLISHPRIALQNNYNVKVFSLNNWDELFKWLDELEAGMSEEHRAGLKAAYPHHRT